MKRSTRIPVNCPILSLFVVLVFAVPCYACLFIVVAEIRMCGVDTVVIQRHHRPPGLLQSPSMHLYDRHYKISTIYGNINTNVPKSYFTALSSRYHLATVIVSFESPVHQLLDLGPKRVLTRLVIFLFRSVSGHLQRTHQDWMSALNLGRMVISLHLYEPLGMAVPFIKLAADNGNLNVSEVLPSEASVLIISSVDRDSGIPTPDRLTF